MLRTEIVKQKGSYVSGLRYFSLLAEYLNAAAPIGTAALTDIGTVFFPANNIIYLLGMTCTVSAKSNVNNILLSSYIGWYLQTSSRPIARTEQMKIAVAPTVVNLSPDVVFVRGSLNNSGMASFVYPDGKGLRLDTANTLEIGVNVGFTTVTSVESTVYSSFVANFAVETIA